jgi:hypothetical protein
MKELILHLGFHKTATSSIQETLGNNIAILNQNGLCFPIFRGPENERFCNHSVPIHNIFSNNSKSYRMNLINNVSSINAKNIYKEQLLSFMKTPHKLLLSGESISTLNLQELKELHSFFQGYKIRVIAFIRDSYSYHCSAIQQRVKGGTECLTNPEVVKNSRKVINIKSIFPETEFHSFQKACDFEGGPVRYFLELIDCNYKEIDALKLNEGVSFHSVRLLNYINKKEPAIIDGFPNPTRKGFTPHNIKFGIRRFVLTQDELSGVIDEIKKEDISIERETELQLIPKLYETNEITPPTRKDLIKLLTYSLGQPRAIRRCIYEYLQSSQFASKSKIYYLYCQAFIMELPNIAVMYSKVFIKKVILNFINPKTKRSF